MATKTKAERETIICRAMDEDAWHVFSEDPVVVRKLTRIHGPGAPKGQGWVWRVPRNGISFRNPRKSPTGERQKGNDGLARWRQRQADSIPGLGNGKAGVGGNMDTVQPDTTEE